MRIMIVTDAWYPQVNGVVRTLDTVKSKLSDSGHEVSVLNPHTPGVKTIPCPTYPDINLAVGASSQVARSIEEFAPNCLHIATEGPMGLAARKFAKHSGIPFTTSFHTKFPEYIYARTRIPTKLTYSLLRWFHRRSRSVMVNTKSMEDSLRGRGFRNLKRWTRGVDTDLFRPSEDLFLTDKRPIHLYVGRVAVEKNLESFLDLDLEGTKYVVGDGPLLNSLKLRYPDVRFAGFKYGLELAHYFAAADVFVFPSRTDTFGLVMLEALACGVPVAAYPVTGPLDVITNSEVGSLDFNLKRAIERAYKLSRHRCREFALQFSWQASANQFLENLHPIP